MDQPSFKFYFLFLLYLLDFLYWLLRLYCLFRFFSFFFTFYCVVFQVGLIHFVVEKKNFWANHTFVVLFMVPISMDIVNYGFLIDIKNMMWEMHLSCQSSVCFF